jgi:NAD(P)-dependent dehydrogenase (short-subunit alcohol dehydrogenase family)
MLAIRGANSQLAVELAKLVAGDDAIMAVNRDEPLPHAERYLFAQGFLAGKAITSATPELIAQTFMVNAALVIGECDLTIANNDRARICIIGSESGFAWSFDGAYAASKAAVHRYVETKELRTAQQQLICVAPGIIKDAGMTTRRADKEGLARREAQHPKRRFLTSLEVARLVHHVLYVDEGYLSGVIIRMNGGEHTCR